VSVFYSATYIENLGISDKRLVFAGLIQLKEHNSPSQLCLVLVVYNYYNEQSTNAMILEYVLQYFSDADDFHNQLFILVHTYTYSKNITNVSERSVS